MKSGWPYTDKVTPMKIDGRIFAFATVLTGLALSGCVSDPTYGTGKTASSQLMDDMSSIASFGPKRNTGIEYKPRPDLVKPVAGQSSTLPPPQESVARAGDPSWPESPEQRRARLRSEINANRDNPDFISPIAPEGPSTRASTRGLQTGNSRKSDYAARSVVADPQAIAAAKARQKEMSTGSATERKFLSEPPVNYRQPATTAVAGELGQDEVQKERDRKAAATGTKTWRDRLGL